MIASPNSTSCIPTASQVFLLDNPESWLEVAAASLINRTSFSRADSTPKQVFAELQHGHLKTAKDRLRQMCGIQLDETTTHDQIELLAVKYDRELPGQRTGQSLRSSPRLPTSALGVMDSQLRSRKRSRTRTDMRDERATFRLVRQYSRTVTFRCFARQNPLHPQRKIQRLGRCTSIPETNSAPRKLDSLGRRTQQRCRRI